MTQPQQRYVDVNGRRVHYRRLGEGPPVVMLHATPANSEMVINEMVAAAPWFTCFAFDTPGFGESQPLATEVRQVADLAEATAQAMEALGLPACPVYGTHSGAAIGLALGVGWPERVSGLVLEGLPIFTEEERAPLITDDYTAVADIDALGGHLTAAWVRFRDQFTWFPWASRDVTRLNPVDRPTPEDIHHWVMMYWRTYATYASSYRAILRNGQGQSLTARALELPAVFMASEEDMLYPHLDRLPPLKSNQRIERLPHDPAAKHRRIVEWLRDMPSGEVAPAARAPKLIDGDPAKQFFDLGDGQVFVRAYGERSSPAVILLHDAPGTGLALERHARDLAASGAYVIVPDLPGAGDSWLNDLETGPLLEVCADAIQTIADALMLDHYVLAGLGCGATVAVLSAARRDPRLSAVAIEDLPRPDANTAAHIAPELPLTPEGAHWIKAWLMLRDNQIYKPWFAGTVASQRRTQGNFDAAWLHAQTVALMRSRAIYHRLPREAWNADMTEAATKARAPFHVAGDGALFDLISTLLTPESVHT